jgi:signal transduction histidine kinase
LIILLLVWRNSLQRKKAFALLQKQNLEIEGQKREATIEAALERIRATSMAMQQSSELLNVIKTITTQLGGLGVDFEGSDFVKVNDDKSWDMWICTKEEMQPFLSHIPYFEHREFLDYEEAKKNHVEFYSYSLTPEESLAWMDHFFNRSSPKTPFPVFSDERMQRLSQSSSQSASVFVHREILLAIFRLSDQPFTDEENSVFKRIGKVFEQAYTRFLDLKKAEAQARESQIELALERVRARTMAMQRSEELSETAAVLFQQFRNLGTELIQVTIGVFNETEHVLELRVTDFRGGGAPMSQSRNASLDEPTLISKAYRAWKEKQKSLIVDLQGDELRAWIAYRNQMVGETDNTPFADRRVLSYAFFSKGEISISSAEPLPAETMRLLERFAAVFDGTYTRFLDLKKAEAQAREAQIEAALERVRSRTMAMRSSDELAETAEVLFKQLITLGIAPNRLFIGIIAEDNGEIELWATNEDGSKLAARFTGNKAGNTSVAEMYGGWKRREGSITIVMEGKVLDDYFKYLKDELKVPFPLGLTQKRRIQSIAYFSKGFIGMASPEEQPKETISLLERFAGVFNLTFVRFHDLKIAEAHAKQAELDLVLLQTEKKRTEEAFIELKATQAQLIQSEKMASLGELTAGIAHEIQNPLNFVNNFSEVNQELLAEMKEEIEKGNYEEVKAIVGDIEENEIKINHHGKRADSIVKGMLQHSRAGSHIKAPTNINALADEYLRLSYHGLRAKDKTFNAELITHFVDGLPLVKMVPLDIGRVLLNLFNNAFYAVKERQKTASVGYKPEVTVSTEWEKDHIVIRVKDNGNGIPDAIKDKIMQPFFTTKPTGEGTGLGLSLSYDIVVKGHGGSIQVDSDEGEGSEFVISLPIK